MRVAAVAVLTLWAGVALAGPHDFVIEHAGVGGDSAQAKPYIQQFLGYLEEKLGWPKGSSTGEFFPDVTPEYEAFLRDKKPGFGMIDPDQVLALQKSHQLVPLVTVTGKNQSLGHLHLIAKDPAVKGPADLAGKTIATNRFARSPKFVSKIVFDGKGPAEPKLESKGSLLKVIKAVDGGQADAGLLSDEDLSWFKTSPFASTLKVVWSSAELPPMTVVAFGKNAPAKDRDAVAKALLGMCADPKGADVCKSLDITKFGPPDKAAYDAALKKLP